MSSVSIAPFLGLDEVRQQLGLKSVLDVRRVITKGYLKASKLADGSYAVTTESLSTYIGQGLPDVQPRRTAGGWFEAKRSEAIASGFGQVVLNELAAMWPEDVRELALGESEIVLRATMTAGMLLAGRKAIETSKFDQQDDSGRYETVIRCFLAMAVRKEVASILRQERAGGLKVTSNLERLYAGPEEFQRLFTKAVENFQKTDITLSKTYKASSNRPHVPRKVVMRLKGAQLLTPTDIAPIRATAF